MRIKRAITFIITALLLFLLFLPVTADSSVPAVNDSRESIADTVPEAPTAYTVSVSCGAGGNVMADGKLLGNGGNVTVKAGGNVKVTALANDGYRMETLICDTKDKVKLGDNDAAIIGVDGDAAITVTFAPIAADIP